MKIILSIFTFLSVVTFTFGVVQGSAHDFSSEGWSNGEICLPCHTPHNSDTTILNAPLWNHELSTATYTVYYSPTMDVVASQPGGVSVLCLSCHDGTIALDSYGGNTGGTHISGMADLSTDLSDDHPIGIRWQHQTNDLGSGSGWCLGCHKPNPGDTNPDTPFFSRSLECATCHDVHNGYSYPSLLRLPITNSEICLYCHNK